MYSTLKRIVTIFILISFVFMLACGSKTPTDAYKEIEKAWSDKNWSKAWDGVQSESQQVLCASIAMVIGFSAMADESMQAKIEKELTFLESFDESKGFEKNHFVKMMVFIDENFENDPGIIQPVDIVEKEAGEKRALLISKRHNGETEEIVMVKEDGKWKMFLDNPFA